MENSHNRVSSPSEDTAPAEPRTAGRHLLAVGLSVIPLSGFTIWFHLTGKVPSTLGHGFLFPLLVGGGAIVYMLLLLRYLCGESPRELNLRPGRWYGDVLGGLAVTLVYGAVLVGGGMTVARWLPSPPSRVVVAALEGLATNPLLLTLCLGPVVWIGVAGFEELSKVFLLSRLWKVWGSPGGRWAAVVFYAALFGAVHVYQGTAAMLIIGVQGLVGGAYYLRFGRVWPLIVAHGVYDSVQIAIAVAAIRAAGG